MSGNTPFDYLSRPTYAQTYVGDNVDVQFCSPNVDYCGQVVVSSGKVSVVIKCGNLMIDKLIQALQNLINERDAFVK